MVYTEKLMRIQAVVKIVLNQKGIEKAHSFKMENYAQ